MICIGQTTLLNCRKNIFLELNYLQGYFVSTREVGCYDSNRYSLRVCIINKPTAQKGKTVWIHKHRKKNLCNSLFSFKRDMAQISKRLTLGLQILEVSFSTTKTHPLHFSANKQVGVKKLMELSNLNFEENIVSWKKKHAVQVCMQPFLAIHFLQNLLSH